jgi:paraquat-inducible protein B
VSASPEDAELEAVVREFDGAMSSANSKAAARLILEARRERDDETAEAEQYQKALHAAWRERDEALALKGMGSELPSGNSSTLKRIAALTAERDAAREEAAQWARQHHQLGTELDKALARVEDLMRLNQSLSDQFVEAQVQRDAAREFADFYKSAYETQLKVEDVATACADEAESKLTAALARVRELEGKLSQAVAHGMDWGRARIAQLEAERVKATTGELCACGNPKGHTEALVAKITIDGCTVVCDPNRPTGPGAPMYTVVSLADWQHKP